MKELIGALIKARRAFQPIAKDRVNPFHKSKYATLDSVLESVGSSLCDNGLAITATVSTDDNKTVLITTLHHTSGESIESRYPLPNIDDPQKLGAAITYARRYSICALLNVTADEDDDGNAAKSKPKSQDVEGDAKAAKVLAAMPESMKNAEVLAIIQEKWGKAITTPRQLTHTQVDELVSLIQSQAA